MAATLLDLPDELLLKILAHLSADNAVDLTWNVPLTCKRLNNLCRDPSVWANVGASFLAAAAPRELVRLWDHPGRTMDMTRRVFELESQRNSLLKRELRRLSSRLSRPNVKTSSLRLSLPKDRKGSKVRLSFFFLLVRYKFLLNS